MLKTGTTCLLLLLTATALVNSAVAAPEKPDQKAIRARRDAYVHAVEGRNIQGAMAIIAPGFTVKQKGGKSLTREDWQKQLAQVMLRLPPGGTIKTHIEKVVVKGSTGEVTVTDQITYTDEKGELKTTGQHVKETWKKTAGKWVIASATQL